jgi:hypothetical protein
VSIIGGLDMHRRQVTFDWIDRDSGEAQRGRIAPATRDGLRRWLEGSPCDQARSRWRGAPGGGSWPRSCARPGSGAARGRANLLGVRAAPGSQPD